jgi:hypothetical protein
MAAIGLRFEDGLKGASNFIPWKARITLILIENGLWEFANTIVTPPMDPKEVEVHNQKDVKAERIILDVLNNHLIPHLSKKLARDMHVALTNLFESSNANMNMVLRENIKDTKLIRSDTMKSYLTRITQVHGQLATVGEVVSK